MDSFIRKVYFTLTINFRVPAQTFILYAIHFPFLLHWITHGPMQTCNFNGQFLMTGLYS